jgi:hypothetical protein
MFAAASIVAAFLTLLLAAVIWAKASARRSERDALQAKFSAISNEHNSLHAASAATAAERDALVKKYAPVTSAEAHAEALRWESQAALDRARSEALEVKRNAEAQAEALRQESQVALDRARSDASTIIAGARSKAEEVAAEALEAKRNAEGYTRAAEAMKNVIEGYGDRYLIPTFSVLDALGEEYGFDEAGQKLKAAREHTRRMVKERTAATTDYVEANRRETAVDFVVDAFNGKVDTILASAKRDNYGTLEQKIRDACALVDHNGEAFRNARVLPEYLDARLKELKWAVAVHELREKDKEEQRQLREQIREEEKAQREYERAIKEAAKEEETLHKLQARVQAEFDKATDEQKAKYEAQLNEVNERLRVAEEKNKRALSMAQQTRAGHIYVISNQGSFGENVLKIGMTRRLEPEDRIRELGDASVPFAFDIHALIRSDDAPTLERALHKKFVEGQVNKVNPRKEFFRVQVEAVRSEVERLGLAATWTLAGAAREYHETLAIEKAMREKTFDTKDWANKQVKEHDAAASKAMAAETEPAA